jgi:hypothetical protein
MPEIVVLRCGTCGLPWAKVQNGTLIVESHHHSDKHVNVMPLAELQRLADEAVARYESEERLRTREQSD